MLQNDYIPEPLKQSQFDFDKKEYMGRDDYMVTKCNYEAFMVVDSWPNWTMQGLSIYGPTGCGKTHLAHLFVDKIRTYENKPIDISIINAHQINLKNYRRIAENNQSIVIEHLSSDIKAEAMFHLFNIYNNKPGRYMLFTSDIAPSHINFGLKDLQSRLNMLPSIEIKEPDDVMLQALIVKLFNDRQIIISNEILNYIIAKSTRSFAYIQSLVEEIDYISIAYQSAVNYKIVNMAIDILNKKNPLELDLFG